MSAEADAVCGAVTGSARTSGSIGVAATVSGTGPPAPAPWLAILKLRSLSFFPELGMVRRSVER